MDKPMGGDVRELGGQTTSRIVTVSLRSGEREPELFCCHSHFLKKNSRFFAEQLSEGKSNDTIEIQCSVCEHDHYAKVLKLLHLPEDTVLEAFDCVKATLGILQASLALRCEGITKNCVQYLEAVTWDEEEEEELLKVVPALGPVADPILARLRPVQSSAAKAVLLSAIGFASTLDPALPPFTDALKASAQEQVEYMLAADEDAALVAVDDEVVSAARAGMTRVLATLKDELLVKMPLDFDRSPEATEQRALQSLSDVEWMCNTLSTMEMMGEFVDGWMGVTEQILTCISDRRYSASGLWAVKAKVFELAAKAFDAVGYGQVALPAEKRLWLIRSWLPYMRETKPLLDERSELDASFGYKLDDDLCQNIEGAIVSLVLSLPSDDQAVVLAEWLKRTEEQKLKFPDLSQAFEVWCYRAKTAQRRFVGGGNPCC